MCSRLERNFADHLRPAKSLIAIALTGGRQVLYYPLDHGPLDEFWCNLRMDHDRIYAKEALAGVLAKIQPPRSLRGCRGRLGRQTLESIQPFALQGIG